MDLDFAQSQNETPNQNDQTNKENVSPGVQDRINELTAQFRDAQRQAAAKDEQIAALMTQLISAPKAVAAPQQEEAIEVDPEDKKKFDYLFRQFTQPFQQEIQTLKEQLQRTAQATVPTEVSRYTQDQAVAAEAQRLLSSWANHPVYKSATAEDAVNIAAGKLFREGKLSKQVTANDLALDVPTGGRASPASRSQKKVDLNQYDVETLAENMESFEDKLGDIEF